MSPRENIEEKLPEGTSESYINHNCICMLAILMSSFILFFFFIRNYFPKKSGRKSADKINEIKQSFKLLRNETDGNIHRHISTITNLLQSICLEDLSPEEKMQLFWFCVKTTESMKISQVTEYLFVSGISGLSITKLENLGITLVINAAKNCSPSEWNVKTVKLPIDDNEDFNITPYFSPVSKLIKLHADHGGKILIHCHAGVSRSISICCAYLMTNYSMTAYKSLEFVRDKRRIAKPNPRFMQDLLNYENKLKLTKIIDECRETCKSQEISRENKATSIDSTLNEIMSSLVEITSEKIDRNIDALVSRTSALDELTRNLFERIEKIEKSIF